MIGRKFIGLRKSVRLSSVSVIKHLYTTYITDPHNTKKRMNATDVCSFCGSQMKLTREHVLPRWTYENCDKKFFITDINGHSQTYNKTTVPACKSCNNDVLSNIESYVISLLTAHKNGKREFSFEELENLIRWLEIIEYKFQVLEVKRTFKSSKSGGYIPFLTNYPLTVMRNNINYSPYKAIVQLRHSNKRLVTKSKNSRINSLVVFRTKKDLGFHFFHTLNDFIYLELPNYKTALFYFYEREFYTNYDAYIAAMEIIRGVSENE